MKGRGEWLTLYCLLMVALMPVLNIVVALLNFENYLVFSPMVSVVVCDIDNFKAVNDRYGHAVGDQVICGMVQVLRHELREGDVCARFGGDEFFAFLPYADVTAVSLVTE